MRLHYQQDGELKKAGLATLKYDKVKSPSRKGNIITIPDNGWDIFQLLPDFSEFLLLKSEPEESDSRYTEHRKAWFGGTDEQPFLVELTENANMSEGECKDWLEVWKCGEFFDSIKPEIIGRFEKHYGKEKTLRQGDMFCYPMPIQDWDKLLCVLESVATLHFMKACKPNGFYGSSQLYKTRHYIDGDVAIWGDNVVGKGTIKAPDHSPLVLNKICVIAQTRNLNNPEKAD